MNQRRALAAPKTTVATRGDTETATVLGRAFERSYDEDFDTLTHGFHSWPARLHRSIAAEILDGLSPTLSAGPIVDPFMGGGTTLVEAMIRGRETVGIDLNPLAVRVATVRTRVTTEIERITFLRALEVVTEANLERIREKAPSTAPLSKAESQWYDGHVLRGLAGLFEEISNVEDDQARAALEVVFSSILVKFSRQRADTSENVVKKRIGRFTATEFFHEKGLELSQRWSDLARSVPANTPAPRLFESDARNVAQIVRGKAEQRPAPALILTSPPYGGTYDYAQHHARRLPWLGLDDARLLREEIGARRRVADAADGKARWDAEIGAFLNAVGQALDDDGHCVLVIGDGVAASRFVPADDQIEHLAQANGLVVTAIASTKRPDWSARAPREEHLVALRKVTSTRGWAPLEARLPRVPPKPAVPDEDVPTKGTARSRAWKEGNRPPRHAGDVDKAARPARTSRESDRNPKDAPSRPKRAPVDSKRKPDDKKRAPVDRKRAPVDKKRAPVDNKRAPVDKKRAPDDKKRAENATAEPKEADVAPLVLSDAGDAGAKSRPRKSGPKKKKPGAGAKKASVLAAKAAGKSKPKLSAKAKAKEKERAKLKTKEKVRAKTKKKSRAKKPKD